MRSLLAVFPVLLDLVAQLGDRGTDGLPTFEKPAEFERELLIDRTREGDQRFRRSGGHGIANVVRLAGQQFEPIHVVSETLCPFPFLTDRLLCRSERRDGAADRAQSGDRQDPVLAHCSRHAARGYADRCDAAGEGGPAQPLSRGVLVLLAAPREIGELIFEQVLGDQIEGRCLSDGVLCRGASREAIEILAAQLFRAGSAAHPVARQIACVQLIEARRGVATDAGDPRNRVPPGRSA